MFTEVVASRVNRIAVILVDRQVLALVRTATPTPAPAVPKPLSRSHSLMQQQQ